MDGMDDSRRGPDAEYFRRQEQEGIEKLRAKMKISADAKAAGLSSMKCPRCDGSLKETKVENVMVDICEQCAGVWLDSGELEQLSQKESKGWFSSLWNPNPKVDL